MDGSTCSLQTSKRSRAELVGRTDSNVIVVFPMEKVPCHMTSHDSHMRKVGIKSGDYVHVKVSTIVHVSLHTHTHTQITDATSLSLRGVPIARTSLQLYQSTQSHNSQTS